MYRLYSVFVALLFVCCKDRANQDLDKVFRYNESANLTSLDPAFARTQAEIWVANQLFNTLVQLDDSLQVRPDLAKSWVISDDGLRYLFTLRDDVYFHDNEVFGGKKRKLVSHDVLYSLQRLQDSKVASSGAWILREVKQMKAVNDTLFQIELHKPFPAFLGLLSMKYASVIPHEGFNDGRDFRKNPIGTGPFAFKIWKENVKLVLRKNPSYFEQDEQGYRLPYLEAVAITFLPDKQSSFLNFVQNKTDFISGLDSSYKDEIIDNEGKLRPKYTDDIQMYRGAYLNTEYLGFRPQSIDDPLHDKRIRKALNYGFDRQEMVLYLRNNMGIPAHQGFVPEGLLGRYPQGFRYDINLAKSLVEQYKKEKNTQQINLTLSTNSSYLDIAEYLQRQWQKIGIEVAIDIMPNAALRQGMATGKVSFFRGSWIADYPDAQNYLSLFYSQNKAPNGPNYTHFENSDFDSLYEQSFYEVDSQKRMALYIQMDSIIIENAPVIPLFYDELVRFAHKNTLGITPNPLNLLNLKKVKKQPL
ncbi:MAG: ABC transporter substrate-binding protein [Bacteroidota bacterium]|nr:ABC transporter substrate-binding protein [Bacteroidota bacterium]